LDGHQEGTDEPRRRSISNKGVARWSEYKEKGVSQSYLIGTISIFRKQDVGFHSFDHSNMERTQQFTQSESPLPLLSNRLQTGNFQAGNE